SNEYVDCGGSWLGSGTRKMFRTISTNAAGDMIATAYFTQVPGSRGGQAPTGYMLVSLAADGALALEQDYSNTYYSRVARFFSKP
ncbi:MAG: hypothetical protein OEM83_05165, partial [Gammaproteobacteria bacterium]|nr:hypothetical protein [Gammaproteobacteria bacterium]